MKAAFAAIGIFFSLSALAAQPSHFDFSVESGFGVRAGDQTNRYFVVTEQGVMEGTANLVSPMFSHETYCRSLDLALEARSKRFFDQGQVHFELKLPKNTELAVCRSFLSAFEDVVLRSSAANPAQIEVVGNSRGVAQEITISFEGRISRFSNR